MKKEEKKRLYDLYKGFCEMPYLWNNTLDDLEQFHFTPGNEEKPQNFNLNVGNQRLGKLAEKLFSIQIKNTNEWNIIFENLQIFEHKKTIGELDVFLQNIASKKYYHVEIVTKFYLYNPKYNCNSVDAWIGPNRNDSLAKKIAKLKNKQLPLLFNPLTKNTLKEFPIHNTNIAQKVYFKAWLFIPINFNTKLSIFNSSCIGGFYMSFEKFIIYTKSFSNFYVPSKQDWLRQPKTQTEWFSFKAVIDNIKIYMHANKAALVWVKNNHKIERIMVTPYAEI